MAQTRRQSLIEVTSGVVVGYLIAIAANHTILPYYGATLKPKANLIVGIIYTGLSMLRGYGLRRFFNFLWSDVDAN